jgi:hypothetical protein
MQLLNLFKPIHWDRDTDELGHMWFKYDWKTPINFMMALISPVKDIFYRTNNFFQYSEEVYERLI